VSHARGANIPVPDHALWFYSQMVRWGQVAHTPANAAAAAASYRPDLYRAALVPERAAVPDSAPASSFFDDQPFAASRLDEYIAGQRAHDGRLPA
jgi:hypothetical protein